MTVPTMVRFQQGYRLMDGAQVNKIIDNVAAVSPQAKQNPAGTSISTAGAGTLTAAALVSGLVLRTGPTAAYTDTTATAAQLVAAMSNPSVGQSWYVFLENNTKWRCTLAAGSGVTLSGLAGISPFSVAVALITYSAATPAFTLKVIGQWDYSRRFALNGVIGTADNGTTQTLTAAMIAGGNPTYHVSTGGTTPTLTLPLCTDLDTALPDFQIGQSYTLRVINSNSGQATIQTNTGWTTSGTLTLATNTWREFLITKTAAGTYTITSVGTGTNS